LRPLFVCAVLMFFAPGCQNSSNQSMEQDQDIAEVARMSLTIALVDHDIPDYGLIKDPTRVILEDSLVSPEMVPELDGITITVLPRNRIQQTANAEGDFVFLKFMQIETDSLNRITVALATVWAVAANSTNLYLSGGFNVYRFTKINGSRRKELLRTVVS
jgi:hypothetical protein